MKKKTIFLRIMLALAVFSINNRISCGLPALIISAIPFMWQAKYVFGTCIGTLALLSYHNDNKEKSPFYRLCVEFLENIRNPSGKRIVDENKVTVIEDEDFGI
jgi:hypothetical protein